MPSTTQIHNYVSYQVLYEELPHIASRLGLLYGTELFSRYILDLLMDSRDGGRKGFPLHVGSALVELSEIHDITFPEKAVKFNIDNYS